MIWMYFSIFEFIKFQTQFSLQVNIYIQENSFSDRPISNTCIIIFKYIMQNEKLSAKNYAFWNWEFKNETFR